MIISLRPYINKFVTEMRFRSPQSKTASYSDIRLGSVSSCLLMSRAYFRLQILGFAYTMINFTAYCVHSSLHTNEGIRPLCRMPHFYVTIFEKANTKNGNTCKLNKSELFGMFGV